MFRTLYALKKDLQYNTCFKNCFKVVDVCTKDKFNIKLKTKYINSLQSTNFGVLLEEIWHSVVVLITFRVASP